MFRFETTQLTQGYRDHCEDRVHVIHDEQRTIIIVADGAGGIGDGAFAAEAVIREVMNDFRDLASAADWEAELRQIDCRIGVGESTAVVVDLRPDSILGASVGDSHAWIVHEGELIDLTSSQTRKPLLGSRAAIPRGFTAGPLMGVLLVATDGFFNYVKRERLTALVAQVDFFEIPRRCIEMVRLPSGELWDDIGIVVCRVPKPHRTRTRYAI